MALPLGAGISCLGRALDGSSNLTRQFYGQIGGTPGLRDLGLLEASLALPRQSFAGADPYPGLIAKAAPLGFSLIPNHPFGDGNKRIGHAALEITLLLLGIEQTASGSLVGAGGPSLCCWFFQSPRRASPDGCACGPSCAMRGAMGVSTSANRCHQGR